MAVSYTSAKPYFYGTGRRKSSVARVRLFPGTGSIIINGKDIDEYFGLETLKLIINQPFDVTGTRGKFDIVANVNGGGFSGQAGAIRHVLFFSQTRLSVPSSSVQDSSRATLV